MELNTPQISGGDMLIDDYDTIDEKQDVAIITPVDSPEEPDPEPLADDCELQQTCGQNITAESNNGIDEAMKTRFLPPLPDLEIENEGYHTWEITNYRSLSKREHGPTFKVGGHPWYFAQTLVS